MHDTISIAIQLDAKLIDLKPFPPKPHPFVKSTPVAPLPTAIPRSPPSALPYMKLTLEEVQRRKDRGYVGFAMRNGLRAIKVFISNWYARCLL